MTCSECGHADYFHRENMASQHTAVGDPIACFAALYREVAGQQVHQGYCGCTAALREEQH